MQREVVSRARRQIFEVKGSSSPDPFDGQMREWAAREFKFAVWFCALFDTDATSLRLGNESWR